MFDFTLTPATPATRARQRELRARVAVPDVLVAVLSTRRMGTVTAGLYFGEPTECGPYPGAAPAGTATIGRGRSDQGV